MHSPFFLMNGSVGKCTSLEAEGFYLFIYFYFFWGNSFIACTSYVCANPGHINHGSHYEWMKAEAHIQVSHLLVFIAGYLTSQLPVVQIQQKSYCGYCLDYTH